MIELLREQHILARDWNTGFGRYKQILSKVYPCDLLIVIEKAKPVVPKVWVVPLGGRKRCETIIFTKNK
jgi:hypothetical protein